MKEINSPYTNKTKGEKVINGFVNYIDLTGKQNLETFSIQYYVN